MKPDNILIGKDRQVKILDFGLAKRQVAAAADATRTMTVTDPGTVVGTVAYMSPEQARGRELDFRSDQFSFGLILYELATGKRAFSRESAVETMTAIIRDEAQPLPPTIPAPVRWTIERCLAKDPEQRYDSTRDLYRELRQTREGLSQTLGASAAIGVAAQRAGSRWRWPGALVIAAAAGGLLAAGWMSLGHTAAPRWAGTRLGGPVVAFSPRLSPDWPDARAAPLVNRQTQVAILMKPDGGSWNVLTHDATNGSVTNVSWARDGSRLFFDRFWERPAGCIRFRRSAENPPCCWKMGAGAASARRQPGRGHDEAFRFWPDSGTGPRPFPALERSDGGPPLRAFADGKEIVFIGATDEAGVESGTQPYILDLATRKSRRLDPKAPSIVSICSLVFRWLRRRTIARC